MASVAAAEQYEQVAWDYRDAPTLARFAASNARVRAVMGPFGSGKSSVCVHQVVERAQQQAPGPDGVRHTRCAIVRNTFPQLRDTTMKTWFHWFPQDIWGEWKGESHTHQMRWQDDHGVVCECEVMFRAMDVLKQVRDLLSAEYTFAWFNEAREFEEGIISVMDGRIGRYPAVKDGGATWSGIWMDTNPPDDLSWWYRWFEEELLDDDDYQLFKQPSGISSEAENLPNLPENYYRTLAKGKSTQFVKAFVHGEYATIEEGRPIYKGQWADNIHVANEELWPMKRQSIGLGWDYGLTPACIIVQQTPRGQLRVLEEIVGTDMGIRQLARIVKPILASKYRGLPIEHSIGDPSGIARSETDKESAFDVLMQEGLPIEAAPSNKPTTRFEWVRWWLMQLADGGPRFLLNPACKYLRRGFNGGYKLRRLQVSGPERRYTEQPDKNQFSHPHEALQYICSAYYPQDLLPAKPPRVDYTPADRIVGV